MEISPSPSVWQRAADLAAVAHAGQTTDGKTPYIAHPVRVAMIVQIEFGCADPEIAAAALLHDVLEKTAVTAADIREQFSRRVAEWVEILSKNMVPDGETYWSRLNAATWEPRLIKIADALDHFDCPLEDLEHRMGTGEKALALAGSCEGPIQRAKAALLSAMEKGKARLGEAR